MIDIVDLNLQGFKNLEGLACQSQIPSPDRNDILFCCGWSEAEAVTKKIQWIAGNCSLKNI
jgi:hypothetical protein